MVDKVKVICVGDQVERINGHYIVGTRHYEVARMLKELPKDKPFTLKLIEPMKAFGELRGQQTPAAEGFFCGKVHSLKKTQSNFSNSLSCFLPLFE